MIERIKNYLNEGLINQVFYAERNILIWKYIADETVFLQSKENHIKSLYGFIQKSAQTNFIISLGKIYDNPNNKYPTRCIASFLQLLNSLDFMGIEIVETTMTKELLLEYKCPVDLIESVDDQNKNIFPKLFVKHYKSLYDSSSIQTDISTLKMMRDKVEAHNEDFGDDEIQLPFETTERLIDFVSEIISVIGMAYYSTIWKSENYSFITSNAELNASFIKSNIEDLKK